MLLFKRYTQSNPIATKLLAYVLLCSSLITLIAIAVQLYNHFYQDLDDLDKRLNQIEVSSVASISKSLWAFDTDHLDVQIEGILKLKDIIQVTVRWRNWNEKEESLTVTKDGISANRIGQDIRSKSTTFQLQYQESPTSEVQLLGEMDVVASMEGIYQRVGGQALIIGLQQGTKTILISLIILWLVRGLITRHLEEIAQYARNSTISNLHTPLRLNRKISPKEDELDNVVNGFNQMRLSLLEDIEQRKKTELALEKEQLAKAASEQRQRDAEEANQAKSQFLATMSHEIRTPMNGVIGMIEIMRHTDLNENQRNHLNVIQRSGEGLIALINDILDYSKIEARKLVLEETPFDLNLLISDCLQLFATEANKKSLAFTGGALPNTPTLLIGDPTRLRQLITNLLSNAFKFTEQGHIILRAFSQSASNEDEELLYFSINDSGIGIDPKQAEKLFSPFTQADSTTTRKYGGTGLGLTICKLLVEVMGGEIGVSTTGNGSNFWFTVKLKKDKNQVQPEYSNRDKTLIIHKNMHYCEFFNHYQEQCAIDVMVTNLQHQPVTGILDAISKEAYQWVVFDMDAISSMHDLIEIAKFNEAHHNIIPLVHTDSNAQISQVNNFNWEYILRKPISPITLFHEKQKWLLSKSDTPIAAPTPSSDCSPIQNIQKVLIVEDNPVNQMVVCGLLKKLNIESTVMENGLQALEHFQKNQDYHAILMDCEMPVMDGIECTKKIRAFESENSLKATVIIALTAHALEDHKKLALNSGMDYYLSKPLTLITLQTTLNGIFNNRRPD